MLYWTKCSKSECNFCIIYMKLFLANDVRTLYVECYDFNKIFNTALKKMKNQYKSLLLLSTGHITCSIPLLPKGFQWKLCIATSAASDERGIREHLDTRELWQKCSRIAMMQ